MNDSKAMNVEAVWTIELNAECPHCNELVNLLDDPDFAHGFLNDVSPGTYGKSYTSNIVVFCPECGEEFVIDIVL